MIDKKNIEQVIEKVASATKKVAKEASKTVDELKVKVDDIVGNAEAMAVETTKKAKKIVMKPELYIEYDGTQISYDVMLKKVYSVLETKTDILKVKSVKIFYKIEESKAYCVINDEETIIIEV